MGILKKIDEELDCVEVIFQDYVVSKNKKLIFLFFEGKDDFKYYIGRLGTLKNNYRKYNCNSKKM